ncbi:hypothetical protein B0H17DRAFT_1152115 [Mycena rosella]|uniref:Uncharacterized protein n=1 Tax=Mycena rosella TaxID=1033263 RepID=A0AAD7FEW4_MYCRO|nr:hypothetical protein B0H17DRAFT_1152115 [Mycena rosella]
MHCLGLVILLVVAKSTQVERFLLGDNWGSRAPKLERDIGLSYDRQLLNLAGALQAQDRPYNFTCGQLILTTDIGFNVPIGCIFLGWVILKIFNECQDRYDEIYELSVAGEVATVTVY